MTKTYKSRELPAQMVLHIIPDIALYDRYNKNGFYIMGMDGGEKFATSQVKMVMWAAITKAATNPLYLCLKNQDFAMPMMFSLITGEKGPVYAKLQDVNNRCRVCPNPRCACTVVYVDVIAGNGGVEAFRNHVRV